LIEALANEGAPRPENPNLVRRKVLSALLYDRQNPNARHRETVIWRPNEEDNPQIILATDSIMDPQFADLEPIKGANP